MFFSKKKQNDEELAEKLKYFDEKFRKDYETINSYHERLLKFTEYFIDIIMLEVIKLLMEEDGDRYDNIGKRLKGGDLNANIELEEWIMNANNKEITALYSLKTYFYSFIGKYDELINMWPKFVKKFANGKSEIFKKTLTDLLEASIYFEQFHINVNKKKYLKEKNLNGLKKEMEMLEEELNSVLIACKGRYFEDN